MRRARDLFCFLDDDVEVWPGWLDAMLAGAAAYPDHEVLGGPIRARLEGSHLRACGREPLPVTTLDLGEADTDAAFVWGANLTIRRAAIERVGRFDESLQLYGDEEEFQIRLKAAGGRIRYVADAGVDHRRTGKDAKVSVALALRVLPRAQLAPERRPQAERARPRRRAAHARRLHLAHRARAGAGSGSC